MFSAVLVVHAQCMCVYVCAHVQAACCCCALTQERVLLHAACQLAAVHIVSLGAVGLCLMSAPAYCGCTVV